eukprot:scaffold833_cov352-Pavlova_lutheri.AAC.15
MQQPRNKGRAKKGTCMSKGSRQTCKPNVPRPHGWMKVQHAIEQMQLYKSPPSPVGPPNCPQVSVSCHLRKLEGRMPRPVFSFEQ